VRPAAQFGTVRLFDFSLMRLQCFFNNQVHFIVLMYWLIDFDRRVISGFHPVHRMMIHFDRADTFDQVRAMTNDMNFVAKFECISD
jgi:hypothetical protein